ncbi:hypothetical protein [Candidatus Vagococcus giribetii]
MKMCPECYSNKDRVTPMYGPSDCLSKHTQYICGTCGRCICIEKDARRNLYRWNFPFKSLESAIYYIRTAEYVLKEPCSVYEIKLDKERKAYKIFATKAELVAYLKKDKNKKSNKVPVFQTNKYQEYPGTEVRKLTQDEMISYMIGQKNEPK